MQVDAALCPSLSPDPHGVPPHVLVKQTSEAIARQVHVFARTVAVAYAWPHRMYRTWPKLAHGIAWDVLVGRSSHVPRLNYDVCLEVPDVDPRPSKRRYLHALTLLCTQMLAVHQRGLFNLASLPRVFDAMAAQLDTAVAEQNGVWPPQTVGDLQAQAVALRVAAQRERALADAVDCHAAAPWPV